MPPPGPGPANAPPKISPDEARLRPAAGAAQNCGTCMNFLPPDKCAVVNGPVDPSLVSDAYTPMEGGGAPPGPMGQQGGSPDEILQMMGLQ